MVRSISIASLVLSSLLFSSTSMAELSSSVKVSVRSSSNYIYPCNAGIAQNPKSISKGVDFIKSSWTASQHNPTAQADAGVAIGGSALNNNADTDYALLNGLIGTGTIPYLNYNQLLPENTMYDFVVGQNLNGGGLEVNLSSDTYDSAFFVTFCFKPSLVGSDSRVPMNLKFTHAKATHSAVPGTTYNYATDAQLMSMVEIKCSKDNGNTVQHYTPNGVTLIENLLTPFNGNMTIDMAPNTGIVIGSGGSLIDGPALLAGQIPDDCRVRFYFIETSGKARPHTLTASDIQVDLQATVGTL
jgi:hypothetical protein